MKIDIDIDVDIIEHCNYLAGVLFIFIHHLNNFANRQTSFDNNIEFCADASALHMHSHFDDVQFLTRTASHFSRRAFYDMCQFSFSPFILARAFYSKRNTSIL